MAISLLHYWGDWIDPIYGQEKSMINTSLELITEINEFLDAKNDPEVFVRIGSKRYSIETVEKNNFGEIEVIIAPEWAEEVI